MDIPTQEYATILIAGRWLNRSKERTRALNRQSDDSGDDRCAERYGQYIDHEGNNVGKATRQNIVLIVYIKVGDEIA